MTKKKSPKAQRATLVQSTTFRLPAEAGCADDTLGTVRSEFYESIVEVLRAARSNGYRAVNFIMVEAYWNIGRMIVEEEQQGKDRAEYGSYLLRNLAAHLTTEFGKGLNHTNLKYIRQFYLTYPIGHAPRDQSSADDGSDGDSPLAIRDALRHESFQGPDKPSHRLGTILHALRRELTWTHYRLLETSVI
jgi:uncharacterized protein DUF1016